VNPTLAKGYMSKATVLLLQNKWDEARYNLPGGEKEGAPLKSV